MAVVERTTPQLQRLRSLALLADFRAGRVPVFRYTIPGEATQLIWSITAALQAVKDGLTIGCVAIPPEEMQAIADRNEWDASRLDAVDPTIPGIAAPILHEGEAQWILIDGQHRNARALRDGLGFKAWLLREDVSRACLLQAPAHRIP
jgi:hypothetical protein